MVGRMASIDAIFIFFTFCLGWFLGSEYQKVKQHDKDTEGKVIRSE